MPRVPRSVIALVLGCLVLVGCAAVEHNPDLAKGPPMHVGSTRSH